MNMAWHRRLHKFLRSTGYRRDNRRRHSIRGIVSPQVKISDAASSDGARSNIPNVIPVYNIPLIFIIIILSVASRPAYAAQPQPGLEQTVQYLLEYVSGSGLTFIRNASEYSGQEAAEHMKNKYEHFKDKISTAEDFIDWAASKSLMTGRPYLVIMENGTTIPTRDWLATVLADYRKQYQPESAMDRPVTLNQDIRKHNEQ